ncbi:MAG TPA: hypothetical protein VGO62_01635 [Myxococcota bacterium]
MRLFPAAAILVATAPLTSAAPALAAQVTDVADALDGDNPFDANLELKFDVQRHSGLITRENFQPPTGDADPKDARTTNVKEMQFEDVRFRIRPRLEIGVWHDLSVFAEWPIVIWDQQDFRYADGTTSSNSTFARDEAPNASPPIDSWSDANDVQITQGAGNTKPQNQVVNGKGAFGFPAKPYNAWRFNTADNGKFTGYRQGFDNPTFGVRWSPLNNERDDTKPTITLQADYTPPFFQFMDPTNDKIDDASSPGPVADGAHRFHFSVAMSKRFLILDPYFVIDYNLPLAASGDGSVLGYYPRQSGGFTAGGEIVPYEDKKLQQKFAIDINAFATYFSQGQDYSEVSDVLEEQTYTDQFVRAGVNAGIFFKAFQYFFFDVNGTAAYDTSHLLTIQPFGQDKDGDTKINLQLPNERNPFYNPALDTVGRRVRIEQSVILGVLVHAGITF